MKKLIFALLILSQAASAQLSQPVIYIPECDHRQLGRAARELIGPHPDPTPTGYIEPEFCAGKVCDARANAVWAAKYAERARVEYLRWQNLDLQARACGY